MRDATVVTEQVVGGLQVVHGLRGGAVDVNLHPAVSVRVGRIVDERAHAQDVQPDDVDVLVGVPLVVGRRVRTHDGTR